MTDEDIHFRVHRAFETYVPEQAVSYCFYLWKQFPFYFKIRKPRMTKAGDYTWIPSKNLHVITVNKNLNKYNFLITYIHEVAHLVAFQKYGRKVPPHGKEWKLTFAELMQPMLSPAIFPDDILKVCRKHFKNPKASTAADPVLVRVLSQYNENNKNEDELLEDIPVGNAFEFRSKIYKKLEQRRTRALCAEKSSGKKYLISMAALVRQVVI